MGAKRVRAIIIDVRDPNSTTTPVRGERTLIGFDEPGLAGRGAGLERGDIGGTGLEAEDLASRRGSARGDRDDVDPALAERGDLGAGEMLFYPYQLEYLAEEEIYRAYRDQEWRFALYAPGADRVVESPP